MGIKEIEKLYAEIKRKCMQSIFDETKEKFNKIKGDV
jgi:hypothetical protein